MNPIEFQSTILRQVRAMREETRLSLIRIQCDLDETKLHVMSINERLDSLTTSPISKTVRKPPQSMTGRDVNVAFWIHQQIQKENAKITSGRKFLVFDDDLPWDVLNGDAKRCVAALMALHLDPGWESLTWATIYKTQPKNAERVVEAAGRKPEMAVFAQCAYNWGIRAICEQKQKSNRRTATRGKNCPRIVERNEQFENGGQAYAEVQLSRIENAGRFGSNVRSNALEIPDQAISANELLRDEAFCSRPEITKSLTHGIIDANTSGQNPFENLRAEHRPTFEPVPTISSRLQTDVNKEMKTSLSASPRQDINQHLPFITSSGINQLQNVTASKPIPPSSSAKRISTPKIPPLKKVHHEIISNARQNSETNATVLCNAAILAASKSVLHNGQHKSAVSRERILAATPDPFTGMHPMLSDSKSTEYNKSFTPIQTLGISNMDTNKSQTLSHTLAAGSSVDLLPQKQLSCHSGSLPAHKSLISNEMNAGISRSYSDLRGRGRRQSRFNNRRGSRRRI